MNVLIGKAVSEKKLVLDYARSSVWVLSCWELWRGTVSHLLCLSLWMLCLTSKLFRLLTLSQLMLQYYNIVCYLEKPCHLPIYPA